MKKAAILQSNYIPWKGYFDLIAAVDEFIIYDEVQFTKQDWRNRNLIKTPQGPQWLTVPVKRGGRLSRSVSETEIDGERWAGKHWKTIAANYSKAAHFREVAEILTPVFLDSRHARISTLNLHLIDVICAYLEIDTKISASTDYPGAGDRTERLVDLCMQAGASEYVSGPAAKAYLEEDLFIDNGLKCTWFDYDGYPEHPQLWGAFEHKVSIVDLLFNCGKQSRKYMKCGTP